jgi:hypothetical protein
VLSSTDLKMYPASGFSLWAKKKAILSEFRERGSSVSHVPPATPASLKGLNTCKLPLLAAQCKRIGNDDRV